MVLYLQIMLLELNHNQIGRRGVSALTKCLKNIHKLHLAGCGLSEEDVIAISQALQRRPERVI